MPVSHLGLTVSHIPSATSFYLSALQPLGYHYIGQQGRSIGLGVQDADFFICQEQSGFRPSPAHIAFSAGSRLNVRECYTAALNAGGRPSGAPSYRNDDCSCFNAAVCDPDGNTIEFIFREGGNAYEDDDGAASGRRRVPTWREDVDHRGIDGTQSEAQSLASHASRARSRAETVKDLALTTSKSIRPVDIPSPGITRSYTAPTGENVFPSKTMIGTAIGAAAGAVFAYAMCKSEQENARSEAAFATSTSSSKRSQQRSSSAAPPRTHRNFSTTESAAPQSHRNCSTRESTRSSRYPPRFMRAIEPASYDDEEVHDVVSRYTGPRRPQPVRSRTTDALQLADAPTIPRSSDFTLLRSRTLPQDVPQYYLEAPRSSTSTHVSRRRSCENNSLQRHDSGISMRSHHSKRSVESSRKTSVSKASTIKPSRREASSYHSAAEVPLPSSKATSRASSYLSAAQMPLPGSHTGGYTDDEESDGLGDAKTIVPEDSISCIDFSKPARSERSHRSSKHSHRRDDRSEAKSASTVKPARSKHSAVTMPVRTREYEKTSKNGKRSYLSYA